MRTHVLTCVLSLAPLSAADTLVVDDKGGGDHLTVQAAIDAAQPGDTLEIQPGLYSAFVLDKPLTLRGSGSVSGSGTPGQPYEHDVEIDGVGRVVIGAGGGLLIVQGLLVDALLIEATDAEVRLIDVYTSFVRIEDVTGFVLGDRLTVGHTDYPDPGHDGVVSTRITNTPDARFYRSRFAAWPAFPDAVHVQDSRVEIVESVVRGADYQGGNGLVAFAGSDVWISLSRVLGGEGIGDPAWSFGCGSPGDGGEAVHVLGGGVVRIAGRGDDPQDIGVILEGGNGGNGDYCDCDGYPGYGLRVSDGGTAIHSGIAITRKDQWGCWSETFEQNGIASSPGATVLNPAPRDPALSLLRNQDLGGSAIDLTAYGEPGSLAVLAVGFAPLVGGPATLQPLLLAPAFVLPLGVVPTAPAPHNEALQFTFQLPALIGIDLFHLAQLGILAAPGEVRVSSSNGVYPRD